MSHTPHELHEEFPEHAEKISKLKVEDAHFARLMDEYNEINVAVYRAETNLEPVDDLTSVDMRKQRAHLKDELYRMLTT